ncbi:hypothetical protein PtB15_3B522 [Puccinia triticina]|nr:hypothetical protein PtB15_3B522 [Puccinia triticina]
MKNGLLGKLANMTYAEIVDWLNQPVQALKPWIAMKDGLLGKLANMTYAKIVDWFNQPLYFQHQFPSTS